MGLRDTYAYAIQTAKGKFQGNAEEHEGKLHFKGSVTTEAEKNEIWNAIKTIPTWERDVVADIKVTGGAGTTPGTATAAAKSTAAPQGGGTYTVKSGDTLSKIGQHHGVAWREIFEANKDVIGDDPDKIKPGQTLRIPRK